MKLVLKIAGGVAAGLTLAAVVLTAGCAALLSSAANDTAGSSSSEDVTVPAAAKEKAGSAFRNGILTTPDVKIKITRHKVIPAGGKGNEYSDKPVLALWYKTTNVSGKEVDPMEFLFDFTAYQDNNPNRENKLDVGSLPDDRFLDSQMENIKKGGTVENAVAYELDDLTTPVKLVASVSFDDELGSITYNLK